ncbi:DNA-binding protein HBsu [Clostridiaceae bacterium JG1575]|nr:DNA-binding protein HBsu [Clostridiaceae bacterium JG1575]
MNKAELITKIAESGNMTKKEAEVALNAFKDAVMGALEAGEKVQLVGFGTFEVRERAAREGRNPRTKETIRIPASKVPVFKPGKDFKGMVNKPAPKKKARAKK